MLASGRLGKVNADAGLVLHLFKYCHHRGTDVRLSSGAPAKLQEFRRQPLDANLWVWRVALSYRWKHEQHINVLELSAVLDCLRHFLKSGRFLNKRVLVLLDSQVSLGVLSKGRSSSSSLNAVLVRIAALCRFANVTAVFGWVPSEGNPADGPSRWAKP